MVPGIEITSIDDGRDVHMLGYFFDPASAALGRFLEGQRALRVARVREIGIRLSELGMPIDVEPVLQAAADRPGSSVGRPQLARALVAAGYVESVQQAFEQWLATGQPAYVPRTGPSPATAIAVIHDAGGVASFAHPGVTKRDSLIVTLVDRGLDAIEVYHSDHAPEDERAYQQLATRLGVLISGGSDFHGDLRLRAGRARAPAAAFSAWCRCLRRRSKPSRQGCHTESRRRDRSGGAADRHPGAGQELPGRCAPCGCARSPSAPAKSSPSTAWTRLRRKPSST